MQMHVINFERKVYEKVFSDPITNPYSYLSGNIV
jgi:hypothetical protein